MLCLLTSNVQYLNNSASPSRPGSFGEDRVKAQPGKMPTCSHNTSPRLAPDTIHSIWSSSVRPSPRQEQRVEWNTRGHGKLPCHFPLLIWFAQKLLCVIYIWTFRCSTSWYSLAWFFEFWVCLEVGDGGNISRSPSRTSVELLWNAIHCLWYPWLSTCIIWQRGFDVQSGGLSLGGLFSHLNSGSSLNLFGPHLHHLWNGTKMFPGCSTV